MIMADLSQASIERIVVRGTNWVGDAVMTVPALRALRQLFPGAHITLATRSWAKGLFVESGFLDELLIHDNVGLRSVVHQVKSWRNNNFDLAVLFPNSLESALVASIARVPFRIGYATEGRQRLLTHPLDLPEWRSTKHEVFFYLNIIEQLGNFARPGHAFIGTPDGNLSVSAERRADALRFLIQNGVTGISGTELDQRDRPVIALCPGSTNSRAKRWPSERFAQLADLLIDELAAEVILIGSKSEAEVSQEVQQQMHNRCTMLTGKTDLAQLVSVLSVVDLVVTNDTGPAHIASALNTPTLVIFGPTNPLTTRPFSASGEIMREPPDCAPCMLRDCPIDHRCMTAISPQQVLGRAQVMLRKRVQAVS